MTIIYMITLAVRNGPSLKQLGNMQGFYATEEAAKSALNDFRVGDPSSIYQIEAHGINH